MFANFLNNLLIILFYFFNRQFDYSEDMSFFSSNSPPSSPRPCPISPCRGDSMSSMSENSNQFDRDFDMENYFVDFNSFTNKEKKPYSPARKRLNMDVSESENKSSSPKAILTERNHLQSINENIFSLEIRISSSGTFKRSERFNDDSSPQRSKRHRSENQSPATSSISTSNQQLALGKTISIMNVLRSSSEMPGKNRF